MSPGMARSSPQSRAKARMSVAYDVLRLPRLSRPVRAVLLILLGLFLLPYALTPLYAVMEPVSTVMIWRRIAGEPVVRTYVPLSRISPSLQLAVIIAEDGRFCEHHGVDFQGLQAALPHQDLERRLGGAVRRGHLPAQFRGLSPAFGHQGRGPGHGGAGQLARGVGRQTGRNTAGLKGFDEGVEIGGRGAGDPGGGVQQVLVV